MRHVRDQSEAERSATGPLPAEGAGSPPGAPGASSGAQRGGDAGRAHWEGLLSGCTTLAKWAYPNVRFYHLNKFVFTSESFFFTGDWCREDKQRGPCVPKESLDSK